MPLPPISISMPALMNPASLREPERPSPFDDILGTAMGAYFQGQLQEASDARQATLSKEIAGINEAGANQRTIAGLVGQGEIEAAEEGDPLSFEVFGQRFRRPAAVRDAQSFELPGRTMAPNTTFGSIRDASGNVDQKLVDQRTQGFYEADLTAARRISIPGVRDALIAQIEAANSDGFYSQAESNRVMDIGGSPQHLAGYALTQRQINDLDEARRARVERHHHDLMQNFQVAEQVGDTSSVRNLTPMEASQLALRFSGETIPDEVRANTDAIRLVKRHAGTPETLGQAQSIFWQTGQARSGTQAAVVAWLAPQVMDGSKVLNTTFKDEVYRVTGMPLNETSIAEFLSSNSPEAAKYRALWTMGGLGHTRRSSIQALEAAFQQLPFSYDAVYEAGEILNKEYFNDAPSRPRSNDGSLGEGPGMDGATQASIMAEERANFEKYRATVVPELQRLPPEIKEHARASMTGDDPAKIAASLRNTATTIRRNATRLSGAERQQAEEYATWYQQFGDLAASDFSRFVIRRDSIFFPATSESAR